MQKRSPQLKKHLKQLQKEGICNFITSVLVIAIIFIAFIQFSFFFFLICLCEQPQLVTCQMISCFQLVFRHSIRASFPTSYRLLFLLVMIYAVQRTRATYCSHLSLQTFHHIKSTKLIISGKTYYPWHEKGYFSSISGARLQLTSVCKKLVHSLR